MDKKSDVRNREKVGRTLKFLVLSMGQPLELFTKKGKMAELLV